MNFTTQRQLTVALENYPGRLAAVSSIISQQDINIMAICLVDSIEQGVIRLVSSEPAICKSLLVKESLYVIEADVLAVELTDSPGELARLTKSLADAQINIEYTYGSTVRPDDKMRLILKVSDLKKACRILTEL